MSHALASRLDRSIVLVGLMGAGKSTVGRRLARRLGLPFVDSDVAIEDASGFSTAEIFERFGEKDFRDGERRLIARLADEPVQVIATGGGAFTIPETRKLLNDKCITVWLDAPISILAERTGRRDNRPLLQGVDRAAKLAELMEDRRAAYAEAHVRVESRNGAHAAIVEAIIAALEEHLS
ncbi:shikimate kinase [Sphingomicrobium arenosum]|uniref:shikimate kinase n=1 Tax=Sphingomicrobium arenosum TaxID=2233861 RepID=UPI002240784B|nr:shikimate kinase [Sphingomicrobium arenosum]